MTVFKTIKTRRSIRKYSNLPLEFELLTKILEAGHAAPNTGGHQPWRFLLCTQKDKIKGIKEICMGQNCFDTAQAIIIVTGLIEKATNWYGNKAELYVAQSTAAAIQNMLLVAHEENLGAVWIGAFDEKRINEEFSIPESEKAYGIICLGHPAEKPEIKHTIPLDGVVYFNEHGNKIKNLNIALRDYSLEIKARAQTAKEYTKEKGWGETAKKQAKEVKNKLFPKGKEE